MELFLLVAIVLALGTAALTSHLGYLWRSGAFLGGLLISESEFAHEAVARILPIRDVFVAMFFVSIGMLVRPSSLISGLPIVVALTLVVTVGKFVVWSGLTRLLGYGVGTAVLAGLGLTQIGEFSYILAGSAEPTTLSRTGLRRHSATSLMSILINALVFRRTPGGFAGGGAA